MRLIGIIDEGHKSGLPIKLIQPDFDDWAYFVDLVKQTMRNL